MLARSLFALALLVNASGSLSETLPSSDDKKRLERFEKEVDDLRNRLKIPGLSAVIVKDQKVLWAKGFGFADLENRIPATPDTLYAFRLERWRAAALRIGLVRHGLPRAQADLALRSVGHRVLRDISQSAGEECLARHVRQQRGTRDQGGEDLATNVFVCRFLGLWGHAYDCERNSQTALAKWIEQRRAKGRVAVRVDPNILEAYVGQYQFETLDNRIFTITREGDRLFITYPTGSKIELFAESESRFFLKIRPYQLVFTKGEGQTAHLEIVEGDETFHSKRIK